MESKDLIKLDEPFKENELEWRIQQSGIGQNGKPWARVLCYVTARAIQNRLDTVCGKAGWQTEYKSIGHDDYICKLSINVDGQWVSKEDGAEETKIEAVKGGISGALKRVASQWGIGRYLYELGESWAEFTDDRNAYGSWRDKQSGKYFYWNPPRIENRNHPIPTPVSSSKQENVREKLENILSDFAVQLDGKPLFIINEALTSGNNQQMTDAYDRAVTYLARKGIAVL